jgi:hypothetical protein
MVLATNLVRVAPERPERLDLQAQPERDSSAALRRAFFPFAFNVFFATEIQNMPSLATGHLTVK